MSEVDLNNITLNGNDLIELLAKTMFIQEIANDAAGGDVRLLPSVAKVEMLWREKVMKGRTSAHDLECDPTTNYKDTSCQRCMADHFYGGAMYLLSRDGYYIK